MALPTLDPGVPLVLRTPQRQQVTAQLLRLLIDAGVVHRRDLLSGHDEPLPLAARALNRWLSSALGDLEVLESTFDMHLTYHDGTLDYVHLEWHAGWNGDMYLGTPLDRLEAEAPGLGASVLDLIGTQRVHPMWTPRDSFVHMRYHEWWGKPNEKEMLKEHYPDPEERAQVAKTIITRAMFDEALPAWVMRSLARRKCTPTGLRRIAKRGDWCGAVAKAALQAGQAVTAAGQALDAIDDLHWVAPEEHPLAEESRFLGYKPVFSWDAADEVTQRVYDDMANYAMQVASHEHLGMVLIDADQPDHLRRFLRAMRSHCRAVARLDRLMTLLHEGQ